MNLNLIKSEGKELVAPTVHLNGTGAPSLQRQYQDAAVAVSGAIDKLQEGRPHPRDYYVQGPAAYERAYAEHLSRLNRLQDVLAELSDLFESVCP